MNVSSPRVPLLFVAAMIFLLDLGMIGSLATAWWTLIPPVLTIGFVLAGPNPRLTRWRDGLLVVFLLIGLARALLLPRELARELRWSLGTVGTSGIVLAFVAGAYGGGIGDRIRQISLTRIGRVLRVMSHYSGEMLSLLLSGAGVIWILSQPQTPKWLGVLPTVMLIAALLPPRWRTISQGLQVVGWLPVPVLAVGAFAGAWSYGWMWFVLGSLWITDSVEKLRAPVSEGQIPKGATS